jgi:hypothetical protein
MRGLTEVAMNVLLKAGDGAGRRARRQPPQPPIVTFTCLLAV